MKKNEFIIAMIVLILIACTIFLSDGLTYLIAVLIGIISLSVIHLNRTRALRITRWAKANPKKTQLLIAVMHLTLLVIGVFAGNNLKELGYNFSNVPAYIFSAIFAIGFALVNFLPKRKEVAIPAELFKTRLSYLAIILSSLFLTVFSGNRISDKYPNSAITHFIKSIDHKIFEKQIQTNQDEIATTIEASKSDMNENFLKNKSFSFAAVAAFATSDMETIILPPDDLKKESRDKLKAEKKATRFEKKKLRMINRLEKRRSAFGAAMTAGAVILIILLIMTSCAGICLIIGGIGDASAGYVVLGALILAASVFGITKIVRNNKSKPKK